MRFGIFGQAMRNVEDGYNISGRTMRAKIDAATAGAVHVQIGHIDLFVYPLKTEYHTSRIFGACRIGHDRGDVDGQRVAIHIES